MHIKILSFVSASELEKLGEYPKIKLSGDYRTVDYFDGSGRYCYETFTDNDGMLKGVYEMKAKDIRSSIRTCGIFLHDMSFIDTDKDGHTDENGKTILEYLNEYPDDIVYCIDAHI